MDYPIRLLSPDEYPQGLLEIPQPPKQLYIRGSLPEKSVKFLAVVGSRNYSNYGKQVVEFLVQGLRGYPVCIVSGLAIGIDALAHTAALEAGIHTLAVPGSGLDDAVLYPQRNKSLAHAILKKGGGLLSEFDHDFKAAPWSFPQRNRIMAGMAHATLLIEAREKSGTLITARLAVDYNRDLLVVPGNIFNENSKGISQFLKLGATPVTSPNDILDALRITPCTTTSPPEDLPDAEKRVLVALTEPRERDALIRFLALPIPEASALLMSLELRGLIRESNGMFYRN